MSVMKTRGVLFVHSTRRALCPHIEWTASTTLEQSVVLQWEPQPAAPDTVRGEFAWQGTVEMGAKLASALRGWDHLRYEVTQDPAPGCDGGRWSHVPDLGIFHAVTDVHGNIMVPEDRIRAAMLAGGNDLRTVSHHLDLALGTAWDDELEPFRRAGGDAPIRWLHRVAGA